MVKIVCDLPSPSKWHWIIFLPATLDKETKKWPISDSFKDQFDAIKFTYKASLLAIYKDERFIELLLTNSALKKLTRQGPFQHPPLLYQWLQHFFCNSPTDLNSEECSLFFFLTLQTKKCSGRTYMPQKLQTFTLVFYHSHSTLFFNFTHASEYRNKFWTFSDGRWQNWSQR